MDDHNIFTANAAFQNSPNVQEIVQRPISLRNNCLFLKQPLAKLDNDLTVTDHVEQEAPNQRTI